jgi:hypothetical protein
MNPRAREHDRITARLNGVRVEVQADPDAHPFAAPQPPHCPKHCDVATPPELVGHQTYVCVCCGTVFSWKGPPS